MKHADSGDAEMINRIKPIHSGFGPKVGEYKSHATVAETIGKELARLKKLKDGEPEGAKVVHLREKK